MAPTRSTRVVKFTQARIVSGKICLMIDAGNTFKYSLNLLLVTHLHEDHIGRFHTVPEGTLVFLPHASFILKLKKMNPRVKFIKIPPGKTTKFKQFRIIPFEVQHSSTTKTYGFRIETGKIKLVWLPDFRNLSEAISYLKNLSHLFINASALKKDIEHRDRERHGQQAVMNSLATLRKNKIKPGVIYLIHYGIGMAPIEVKTKYVDKQFPEYKILPTWDNKIIQFK